MKTTRLTTRLLPLLAAFALIGSAHAQTTAVPDYLSYQGRALNADGSAIGAGTPVNRTVTFRVWDHPSNGLIANLIYSEQQVVTISNGEFSALIGAGAATTGTPLGYSESAKGVPTVKISTPAVFGAASRYLGVTIDDGTAAADNEISPRQQFVTSSFAFRAKVAESVDANAISSAMLASGAVGATQLGAASVTNAKLADASVTTAKIADANVTGAKIAAATIAAGNLATGAVTSAAILDSAVVTADMADSSITAVKLADASVTTAKIVDASVTGAKIAAATIAAGNLATGAVTSAAILDGTIATADMADSSVTSAKIADSEVTSPKIADSAVTSAKIADGSITGSDLGTGAVSTGESNLRIVRGTIRVATTVAGNSYTGLVTNGTGWTFTYSNAANASYLEITFTTPFSAPPTIFVSNYSHGGWTQYVARTPSPPTASSFRTSCALTNVSNAGDPLYSGHGNGLEFIAIGPR